MATALSRVSWWLMNGGAKDHRSRDASSSAVAAGASSDFASWEVDSARFPPVQVAKVRSTRPRRRWQSREERRHRVDREFDLVLVPSDGGICPSGSDSDDSDWSIGWLEPHDPSFFSDGSGEADPDAERSFAVLVPCYGHGRCDQGAVNSSSSRGYGGATDLIDVYTSEGKKFIEQLLSSLQSS